MFAQHASVPKFSDTIFFLFFSSFLVKFFFHLSVVSPPQKKNNGTIWGVAKNMIICPGVFDDTTDKKGILKKFSKVKMNSE